MSKRAAYKKTKEKLLKFIREQQTKDDTEDKKKEMKVEKLDTKKPE